jgi:ABC-type molybdate transport system substrate-binding protein
VLAFVVIWLMGIAFGFSGGAMAITTLVAAAVMDAFEFYFHAYIANKEVGMNRSGSLKWQTDN